MRYPRLLRILPIALCVLALCTSVGAQGRRKAPSSSGQTQQNPEAQIRQLKSEIDKLMSQLPSNVQAELRRVLAQPPRPSSRKQAPRPTGRRLPPQQEKYKGKILDFKRQIDQLMVKLPPPTQAKLRRELAQPPKSPARSKTAVRRPGRSQPTKPQSGVRKPRPAPKSGIQQPAKPKPRGAQPAKPQPGVRRPSPSKPRPGIQSSRPKPGPPQPGTPRPGTQPSGKPKPGIQRPGRPGPPVQAQPGRPQPGIRQPGVQPPHRPGPPMRTQPTTSGSGIQPGGTGQVANPLDNTAKLEIEGVTIMDQAVIIAGPGYNIAAHPGFWPARTR